METEKQISIHRHDLQHRLQTINTLLENGEIRQAQDYIKISHETLAEIKNKHWCLHPVLDAVFSAHFRQAEEEGIQIEADMDIPVELQTVPSTESIRGLSLPIVRSTMRSVSIALRMGGSAFKSFRRYGQSKDRHRVIPATESQTFNDFCSRI